MYVATAQSNNYMPAVSTSLLRDGGTALYSLVRHNERYVVGSAHNVARSRLNGDINFLSKVAQFRPQNEKIGQQTLEASTKMQPCAISGQCFF